MGRRRNTKSSKPEALICKTESDTDEIEITDQESKKGFFACYLLTSINPRFKRHTYIGFTVNPRRRIKQHNGELRSGAWRTKTKRPWDMVLCIHGFPTNVSALQFEWAWQNPMLSLAVRKAAANFKSLSGVDNQIKLAYTMLTLPAWQNLKLTVNFFSTKYMKHSSSCLPEQMKVQVRSMDDLPCYNDCEDWLSDGNDSEEECNKDDTMKGLAANTTSISRILEEDQSELIESPTKPPSLISPPTLEDHSNEPSELIESPVRPQSLTVDDGESAEDTIFEWNISSSLDFGHPNKKRPTLEDHSNVPELIEPPVRPRSVSADVDESTQDAIVEWNVSSSLDMGQPNKKRSSIEVEVIEVMSPSPDCRISLHSKRNKRASRICSNIIDLTRSPVFIQL